MTNDQEKAHNLAQLLRKEGASWAAVAKRLNEDAIPTPTGKKWTGCNIQQQTDYYTQRKKAGVKPKPTVLAPTKKRDMTELGMAEMSCQLAVKYLKNTQMTFPDRAQLVIHILKGAL